MSQIPTSDGRLYRVVSQILGLLLLITGVLKLDGLSDSLGPMLGSSAWLLQAFLAAFELGFGGWLLLGLHPQWTRLIALGLFLTFLNVALSRALAGEATCGCAGRAKIGPWWAVAFDAAAVLLLAATRPASEAPRERWRYTVAGLAGLAALGLTAGAGISAARTNTQYVRNVNLPSAPKGLLNEVCRGIERNETALHGLQFESRFVTNNFTVTAPSTRKYEAKDGSWVVIKTLPHTETAFDYTVTPDGVKRVESGGQGRQELVRGQVLTELRPEFRRAWMHSASADPLNQSSRLDPASWGFYVPLSRPADWLARLTVEQVEQVSGLARVSARTAKNQRVVVDFDPNANWLPTVLEAFSPDGSLTERTEVSYQPCLDRGAWLPKIATVWFWPSGKVWSANKSVAVARFDHTIEKITTTPGNPSSADLTVPEGYRVSRAVNEQSIINSLPTATPVAELSAPGPATAAPTRRTLVWPLVAVNLVLFAGFVIARKRVAL